MKMNNFTFKDLQKKKILFIDLDDTLIRTDSNKRFPEGIWDMRINLKMFEALKTLWGNTQSIKRILIVSNQGGIEQGHVNETFFRIKIKYVLACLDEFIGSQNISYDFNYCKSNNPTDPCRKPNTGMLSKLLKSTNFSDVYYKDSMFMIGDASGIETKTRKDFSDSDKETARNFGITYIDALAFIDIVKQKEIDELLNPD